jgi:hypothetical protein
MKQPFVKITVPDELIKILEQLPDSINKKAMRTGIRSAMVPMEHKVRALVKSIAAVSEQSSGATFRAVKSKYGSPKNEPYVYFGVVGVDKRATELITPRKVNKKRTYQLAIKQSLKKDARHRRTIRASLKKLKISETKSTYRRKMGKKAKPIKRVPNKYWHLINRGFTHSRSKLKSNRVEVQGYQFVERAYAATVANAQGIFERAVTKRIAQLIKKHAGIKDVPDQH